MLEGNSEVGHFVNMWLEVKQKIRWELQVLFSVNSLRSSKHDADIAINGILSDSGSIH